MLRNLSFSLFVFLLLQCMNFSYAQTVCGGSLGNPIVNITFGQGQNPGAQLPVAVPGANTNYGYVTPINNPPQNIITDGNYSLVNGVPNNGAWHVNALDHTPNDGNTGYMAFFNAAPAPGVFYTQTVNGLCPGTTYEFSAWVLNAINSTVLPNAATPNVTFNINDLNNNNLATFSTNAIPNTPAPVWRRYSVFFTTPLGINTVVLSLNNTVGGGNQNVGNDLAIDDITFRACGPLTTASFTAETTTSDFTVCNNIPVNLFGAVGPGLNNGVFKWQISPDNGTTWQDIPSATTLNFLLPGQLPGTYLIRLVSAEFGNINSQFCSFNSNVINLTVTDCGEECNDKCYWRVVGNNIQRGNNIFGTLSHDDVRIQTDAADRGILTVDGKLGWNTMSPTAFLHVNCAGGNEDNGLSDVRFEQLEKGEGTVLVIDKEGYVRNSFISPGGSGISNDCRSPLYIPKVIDGNGNLTCSQIYDDGRSVGINTTGPFNYTWGGGLTGPNFPPSAGIVKLDVAGVARSLAYIATSDARFKQDVNDLQNPFKIINGLKGKTYFWNDKAKKELNADTYRQYGFIAQEVKTVMPEAVITDSKGNYGINYNSFIPVLTEGLKELKADLEAEKIKNDLLKADLEDLKNKLKWLSAKMGSPAEENINQLFQNVPNPFGTKTVIEYRLASSKSTGCIVISDLSGREIKRLIGPNPGSGKVQFDAKDFSSGIYIYSLVIDGQLIDSKKMALMK